MKILRILLCSNTSRLFLVKESVHVFDVLFSENVASQPSQWQWRPNVRWSWSQSCDFSHRQILLQPIIICNRHSKARLWSFLFPQVICAPNNNQMKNLPLSVPTSIFVSYWNQELVPNKKLVITCALHSTNNTTSWFSQWFSPCYFQWICTFALRDKWLWINVPCSAFLNAHPTDFDCDFAIVITNNLLFSAYKPVSHSCDYLCWHTALPNGFFFQIVNSMSWHLCVFNAYKRQCSNSKHDWYTMYVFKLIQNLLINIRDIVKHTCLCTQAVLYTVSLKWDTFEIKINLFKSYTAYILQHFFSV